MFASRLNYQLTPFVSWLSDPQAMAIDAFTLDWTNHFLYAFPSFTILPQFFAETGNGLSPSHPDSPQLANTAMVPQANKTLDTDATPPAKTHEQCPSTIHSRTAPPPGHPASSDGLPLIRKSPQSRGISQATQDTILNSWRTATPKTIPGLKWQSFADRRAVDPLNPPVKDVLEFLQEPYDRGLGCSCLNTARSALSSFIVLERLLKKNFPNKASFPLL